MDIEYQFECLSQAMRIQLEQINKYPALVKIDEKEAVFNIEIIVKSVLDCFHNIFDAIQTLSNRNIDFYQYPELHLIILIRNAKHHNNPLKSIFFEENDIVFVDFKFEQESLPCLIYPLKWSDIINKIQSNSKSSAKYPEIRTFIHADEFESISQTKHCNNEKVYINVIPLMLQAGRKLVELCKAYIPNELGSVEAKFFIQHFETLPDSLKIDFTYPYNKSKYADDIQNIMDIAQKFSDLIFNGQTNTYLEDIKYKTQP